MASLTLEMAEKAVKAAQAKARELGTPMTATVVDDAGRLVLSARGDGTGFFTPETSRAKAVAAAAFKRPTKDMVSLRESSPAFWAMLRRSWADRLYRALERCRFSPVER